MSGVLKEARIAIASIVIDAGTQIRAAINEDVVTSYAEQMANGDEFNTFASSYCGLAALNAVENISIKANPS